MMCSCDKSRRYEYAKRVMERAYIDHSHNLRSAYHNQVNETVACELGAVEALEEVYRVIYGEDVYEVVNTDGYEPLDV